MEYSPPPFFKRGPSLLTRFTFFTVLSVVLLVADVRFSYLQVLRQCVDRPGPRGRWSFDPDLGG